MVRDDMLDTVRTSYHLAQIGKGTHLELCALQQLLYPSYFVLANYCNTCYLSASQKMCMSHIYDIADMVK